MVHCKDHVQTWPFVALKFHVTSHFTSLGLELHDDETEYLISPKYSDTTFTSLPYLFLYMINRPPDKSVYLIIIFFVISQPKHMLWVLKRTVSLRHPKHMFKLMDKKIIAISRAQKFCLSKLMMRCIKCI